MELSTVERQVLRYLLNRASVDRPQVILPRTLLASNLNMRQVQVDCALGHLEAVGCIPVWVPRSQTEASEWRRVLCCLF